MSEQKDAFVEEVKKTQVKAGFALRGFLDKLIPSVFLSSYSLYLLIQWMQQTPGGYYPINHVKVKSLFTLGLHTPMVAILGLILIFILNKLSMGRKNILIFSLIIISSVVTFLALKYLHPIPADYIKYTLISISGIAGVYSLYYIIYAKTAFVEVNYRLLTLKSGVFARVTDTTNNTQIKDIDKEQSFLDRILGLEKINFLTKNTRERKVIKYLSQEDANRIFNFLQAYAADSSTEYWMARDRIKSSGSQPSRTRPLPRQQIFDEGNQGDDENGDE